MPGLSMGCAPGGSRGHPWPRVPHRHCPSAPETGSAAPVTDHPIGPAGW